MLSKLQNVAKPMVGALETASSALKNSLTTSGRMASTRVVAEGPNSSATSSLNPFAEASSLLKREYHSGDLSPEFTTLLKRHRVASNILKHAQFEYPSMCHSAHRNTVYKAVTGEDRASYLLMKVMMSAFDNQPQGTLSDAVKAGWKEVVEGRESILEGSAITNLGGASLAEIVDAYNERKLVVLSASGIAGQDSEFTTNQRNIDAYARVPEIGVARDVHCKIIFCIGTVRDIAAQFSVTVDEFCQVSGREPDDEVIGAIDLQAQRNTPRMKSILDATGLDRNELHTLSADQVEQLGGHEAMLSVALFKDFEESYRPLGGAAIEGSVFTGYSLAYPTMNASWSLMGTNWPDE